MSEYTLPAEFLLLIPFLNIIGIFLKRITAFPNWLIPLALGVIGMVFGILIETSKHGMNFSVILYGLINGIIAAGTAVYGHQLIKQSIEKTNP